jgi:hypothetical protein
MNIFIAIGIVLLFLVLLSTTKTNERFDDSAAVCSIPTQICNHYHPQMGCLDAARETAQCNIPMSWQAKCQGECQDKSKIIACMMSKSVDACKL